MACQHQVALFQTSFQKQTLFSSSCNLCLPKGCDRPKDCLCGRPVQTLGFFQSGIARLYRLALLSFHFLFFTQIEHLFMQPTICKPMLCNTSDTTFLLWPAVHSSDVIIRQFVCSTIINVFWELLKMIDEPLNFLLGRHICFDGFCKITKSWDVEQMSIYFQ